MMKAIHKNDYFDFFYKYGLYLVLLVLILVFSIFNSRFFTLANGINLLQQTASTGIAATGLVFVLVTGGLDISMGSTMFISAVLAALLSNNGLGPIGSLLVGIAIGAAIGCINGYFVAKLKIPGLIVTLATLYIIRGIGLTIGGNGVLYFTERVSNALVFSRLFNAVPAVIIVLAITMIIAQLILSQTLFGRQLYAIGNNKTAAQIMGIKVTRNIFLAYVICGALAGLAGIVSGVQVGGVAQTFATGMEFIIISATVLGGVSLFGGKGGAFPAAFIGVLIVMCIQNGLVMAKTNAYFYTIIGGIVIYVAVMLDSMRNKSALR